MKKTILEDINSELLFNWDPIGVSNLPETQDEYLHYSESIYKIVSHSKDYCDLFEYLWFLETKHMGLDGNYEKTLDFSKKLFETLKKRIG